MVNRKSELANIELFLVPRACRYMLRLVELICVVVSTFITCAGAVV